MRPPTYRQYIYSKTLLETNDSELAYKTANYCNVSYLPLQNRKRAWWRVSKGQAVRELMRIGMYEWAMSVQASSFALGDKLLRIAIHGDTTKDQINAIKELNKLLGYHNTLDPKLLKYPPQVEDQLSKCGR